MTKLTTHVLDVYSGKPGKGILVELFYICLLYTSDAADDS